MKCTSGLPDDEQKQILEDMKNAARKQDNGGADPDQRARPNHTSYTTNNQSANDTTGNEANSNTNESTADSTGNSSQTGSNTGTNTGNRNQSQADRVSQHSRERTRAAYGEGATVEGTVSGAKRNPPDVPKPSFMNGFKAKWEEWMQPGSGLHSAEMRGLYAAKNALNKYSSSVTDSLINISENYDAGLHVMDDVMKSTANNLRDAIEKDYGKNPSARTYKLMSLAMRGSKSSFNSLKPETRTVLAFMRSQIDQETITLVGMIHKKMRALSATIEAGVGSKGFLDQTRKVRTTLDRTVKAMEKTLEDAAEGKSDSFLHRAYQYNANHEYRKQARTNHKTQAAARVFFAKHILSEAQKAGRVLSQTQLDADVNVSIQEIFDELDKGRGTDLHTTNSDARLMGKVFAFKGYPDVPPSIRTMLGEIKDPMVNYAVTIQQQNLIKVAINYANEMEKSGIKYGLLSIEPTSQNTKRVTDTGNTPALMMLSTYYTTPAIERALVEHFTVRTADGMWKGFLGTASMVKMGKTVISPATAVRNWISAAWMIAVHGGFNRRGITNSYQVTRDLLNGKGGSEYARMLISLGVVGDGISHKGLKKLSEDIGIFDNYTGNQFAKLEDLELTNLRRQRLADVRNPAQAVQSLKQFRDFAFRFYQGADDFPKVIVFEKYRTLLAKAYNTNIDDPRVIQEAAVRVKTGLFTYSKVNKAIKAARNWPGTPPFISFPAEVIRTTVEMAKSIRADLKSGNQVLVADAWKRILSVIGTAVATEELGQLIVKTLGNADEEDQEMVRISQGRFERNNNIIALHKYADGTYEVLNMARYNPYSIIRNSLNEVINGDDETMVKKVVDVTYELTEPFLQADILTQSVYDFVNGYQEDAAMNPLDNTAKYISLFAEQVSPTLLNQMYRIYNTYQGDSYDYGLGKREIGRESVKVLGASTQLMSIPKQVQFAAYDYSSTRNAVEKEVRSMAKNLNSNQFSRLGRDLVDIVQRAESYNQNRWGKLQSQTNYMLTHGYSRGDLTEILKLRGAGKGAGGPIRAKEIDRLLRGMPAPRLDYPNDAVKSVVNQARVLKGNQASADVQARLLEVKRQMGY